MVKRQTDNARKDRQNSKRRVCPQKKRARRHDNTMAPLLGKPPSPKKRRNILNCHLYVKALNRIEGCFPNTESGAASAQTCRRVKKKSTGGLGAFRVNRIHGEGRKEHGRCVAMIGSGRCRFRPPRAAMDFGGEEGGGGRKSRRRRPAGGPATKTRIFVDSPPPAH